jgi:hypothetical protein
LVSVQDIEGNGVKYLVHYENEPKGFFKLTDDEEWEPFKNFSSFPAIDFPDANMRSSDLDGDGITDLLITEDTQLRWYAAQGKKVLKFLKPSPKK